MTDSRTSSTTPSTDSPSDTNGGIGQQRSPGIIWAEYSFVVKISAQQPPEPFADPEEFIWEQRLSWSNEIQQDIEKRLQSTYGNLLYPRIEKLQRGSIEGVILIIIALGTVSYDFISKYKDFTEGAALIAKHIQSAITYVTRNFLERERRLPTANISVEVHELSPLKLLRKQCPTRRNPNLRILDGQKYCKCDTCGSKFAIEWSDSNSPQLKSFDTILQMPVTGAQFSEAGGRLECIDNNIRDAHNEVNRRQAELDQARAAYCNLKQQLQRNIQSAQMWFWGTLIVAVIAWYLVIGVLENTEWYTGLLVAIGSIPAAIWLHSEWKKVEQQVQNTLRCVMKLVDQADLNTAGRVPT